MKNLLLFFFPLIISSCENSGFDRDKRQVMAKDEIRYKIHRARSFDITAFKEDTLPASPDLAFKYPIRYTIDFSYKDSVKVLQRKRGIVLFTPDGNSIINSEITDSIQ